MCSVVGAIDSQSSKQAVLAGLSRLEYRGYDSAGYATVHPSSDKATVAKVVGSVAQLTDVLQAYQQEEFIGIGHTRWSTHGASTITNAHPHTDCSGKLALVHNGIIENSDQLRTGLIERGHGIKSETDSELIVHLLEDALIQYPENPLKALSAVASCLEGAFACLILSAAYPDTLFWMRSKSPLCVALAQGNAYIASDPVAFENFCDSICYLPEKTVGQLTSKELTIVTLSGEPVIALWEERICSTISPEVPHGYVHEMLKEIFEQKIVITETIKTLFADKNTGNLLSFLKSMKRLGIIGCGTSYHAGLMGKFFFESIAKIPVTVQIASEFLYSPFLVNQSDMYLGISQSGETADTLESIRRIRQENIFTLALTNTYNSSLARETSAALYTQAGVERAVASTKAFSTQIAALYWLAHEAAYVQGSISSMQHGTVFADLCNSAVLLEDAITYNKESIDLILAPLYAQYTRAIFLGRQNGYALALEAALKLKEISYIFAQAYPAGELKHGPLALIDASVPVFIFSSQDPILYRKLLSNAHEIKARGGHICAILFDGQDELAALADTHIYIPKFSAVLLESLAMTGVMQYLCYAIARELKRPIDKPRNLAKSVTVE